MQCYKMVIAVTRVKPTCDSMTGLWGYYNCLMCYKSCLLLLLIYKNAIYVCMLVFVNIF